MRFRLSSILLFTVALVACKKDGAPQAAAAQAPRPALSPLIGPQSAAVLNDPRAQIFLTKGCPQCHSISALQVTSPTNAGPDLALAYTDVRSRFSTSLEEFLHNPTGTMSIVLSSQIQLSPAERDSVIKLLHEINEAKTGHR